jgi:hypothetical protein
MRRTDWMPYRDARRAYKVVDINGVHPMALERKGDLARLLWYIPKNREPIPCSLMVREYDYIEGSD